MLCRYLGKCFLVGLRWVLSEKGISRKFYLKKKDPKDECELAGKKKGHYLRKLKYTQNAKKSEASIEAKVSGKR